MGSPFVGSPAARGSRVRRSIFAANDRPFLDGLAGDDAGLFPFSDPVFDLLDRRLAVRGGNVVDDFDGLMMADDVNVLFGNGDVGKVSKGLRLEVAATRLDRGLDVIVEPAKNRVLQAVLFGRELPSFPLLFVLGGSNTQAAILTRPNDSFSVQIRHGVPLSFPGLIAHTSSVLRNVIRIKRNRPVENTHVNHYLDNPGKS